MAKYRRRPNTKEIDAVQWFPGMEITGLDEISAGKGSDGSIWPAYGIVKTIHGQATKVHPGDFVITEPDGVHHYPCKPDIFADTYELAGR